MNNQKYVFEHKDRRFLDLREDPTPEDTTEFARRLGFDMMDPLQCPPQSCRLIREFVETVHRNILWYVKNRKREVGWYRWYMWLTVVLVILVPGVSVGIPALVLIAAQWATDTFEGSVPPLPLGTIISAQLTALVAGIYGVHRLFSSWLFRRNSAHAFWKAGADLKAILYAIEERWQGQTLVAGVLDLNFLRQLREGRAAAQDIVHAERDTFFQAYAKINVDLQDTIAKSTTGATAVVGKIAAPILKKVAEHEKLKADQRAAVNTARGRLINLYAQQRQLNESIARGEAKLKRLTEPDDQKRLAEQIKAHQAALATISTQLMQAKAAYEERWALYAQ